VGKNWGGRSHSDGKKKKKRIQTRSKKQTRDGPYNRGEGFGGNEEQRALKGEESLVRMEGDKERGCPDPRLGGMVAKSNETKKKERKNRRNAQVYANGKRGE